MDGIDDKDWLDFYDYYRTPAYGSEHETPEIIFFKRKLAGTVQTGPGWELKIRGGSPGERHRNELTPGFRRRLSSPEMCL